MKKIFSDFIFLYKKEPLVMFILSWLLLSGMTISYYAALLLIPFALFRKDISNGVDRMFLFIIMYSFFYACFCYMNGYYESAKGNVIFQAFFPSTFYLLGKWFARVRSENHIVLLLLLLVGFIAIPVFVDVIIDIRENQFINVLRRIETTDGTDAGSATNLGVRVSLAVASIGVFLGKCKNKYEKFVLILFLVVSGLGVTCVMHLINRTGLVIAAVSILTVFVFNIPYFSKKSILLISLGIILLSIFYIPQLEFASEVNEAYAARNEGVSSIETGGGRSDLWMMGVQSLWNAPLGIQSSEKLHYSHNWWLDTNLNGGLFAFICLVLLTIQHLKNSWSVIRKKDAGLLRNLLISINIGFLFTALVEPIMEGFQVYVFLFFMFIGIVQQYRKMIPINQFNKVNL